jgi:hypothetical protein
MPEIPAGRETNGSAHAQESNGDPRTPNLYILGAPKCATSAVFIYLAQHPDIFMARKEMHYFGRDLVFANKQRMSLEDYLGHYDEASTERYRGDGAIWYLFSKEAAEEIAAASPDARYIVLVRNPVDMLHSLHSEFLFQGAEDLTDFGEALGAEEDRLHGKRIPPTCNIPWALQYRAVARVGEQLARYRAALETKRLHVILYDDLTADTPGVYRDVLRFLEIDDTFQPEFPRVNPNTVVRSSKMRDFMRHPPKPLRAVGRLAVRNQTTRWALGNRLVALNTVHTTRSPVDAALRRQIQADLAGDIALLGDQIGRDLSSWTDA